MIAGGRTIARPRGLYGSLNCLQLRVEAVRDSLCVQYALEDYISLLRKHGATCSMSRVGNPYDNARCESFLKTLKQEEIYCHDYLDLEDLRAHSSAFIEEYYNRQRLHSALGYVSPDAFEQATAESAGPAARMSFIRHEEI